MGDGMKEKLTTTIRFTNGNEYPLNNKEDEKAVMPELKKLVARAMGKDTAIGHNSGMTAPELLRQTVAKIERMNEKIKALQADRAEFYKEAKGNGLDPKIIRQIIARRAMDEAKLAEQDALRETYEAALGDYASTALGKAGAPK